MRLMSELRDGCSEQYFDAAMSALLDRMYPSDRVPFALDVREAWVAETQKTSRRPDGRGVNASLPPERGDA